MARGIALGFAVALGLTMLIGGYVTAGFLLNLKDRSPEIYDRLGALSPSRGLFYLSWPFGLNCKFFEFILLGGFNRAPRLSPPLDREAKLIRVIYFAQLALLAGVVIGLALET